MKIAFYVDFPGERGAGLHSYTDIVRVSVESGDPGGEPNEFADHIRQALAEWYDGASVELLADKSPPSHR